jgi:hypothetical protein
MQEVNFIQRQLHTMHSASTHSSLRRLDLNLLLSFEALFRLGSVAAAAAELAMSPSAVSRPREAQPQSGARLLREQLLAVVPDLLGAP